MRGLNLATADDRSSGGRCTVGVFSSRRSPGVAAMIRRGPVISGDGVS